MTIVAKNYEVDPISRIEGHLGVKVTSAVDSTAGTHDSAIGTITEADAHGNLWRGFENFLIGRRANDAITFTQRICGVCPVPHGTASMFAADFAMNASEGYATFSDASGVGVPAAALHIRNIILACEFLMSSITHFYHLAALSYVQGPAVPPWTPFFPTAQYNTNLLNPGGTSAVPAMSGGHPADLWSAVVLQYVKALRIRRLTFEAGALFAGRMPMTSSFVAGGTTNRFLGGRDDFLARTAALRTMLEEVGKFVVSEYVPLAFALGALYPDFDNVANTTSPFGTGKGYGAGLGNFLAWGGFPQADDTMAIKGGVVVDATGANTRTALLQNRAGLATAKAAVEANLEEFISRSRYANTYGYSTGVDHAYPGNVTRTEPKRDDASKYSWMKAPRWGGLAMEVGPLARMVVNNLYLVDGTTKLIDPTAAVGSIPRAYGDLYTSGGALDPNAVHADLLAGLSSATNPSGDLSTAVQSWLLNLKGGLSTMDRLRGRAIESYWMIRFLIGVPTKGVAGTDSMTFAGGGWVKQLEDLWPVGNVNGPSFFNNTVPLAGEVKGYGLVEAPRGALGHFITANNGRITAYQCVVPTTWNGSPKDGASNAIAATPSTLTGTHRGAIEQAMIGAPFDAKTADRIGGRVSGVEVLRIAQSFDPCIACAVH